MHSSGGLVAWCGAMMAAGALGGTSSSGFLCVPWFLRVQTEAAAGLLFHHTCLEVGWPWVLTEDQDPVRLGMSGNWG